MTDTDNTMTAEQREALAIANRAASAFMTLQISVGTWDGIALNRKATRTAALAANADSHSGRLYVDLLGKHQSHVKAVKTAYRKLRDYLYTETLPATSSSNGQKRGDRLVLVTAVPKVLAELNRLAAEANKERDKFLGNYVALAAEARSQHLGDWAMGVDYPSEDEVRARFFAEVSTPKRLRIDTEADLKGLNLPANISAAIAAESAVDLTRQLDAARDELLKEALEQTERLRRQLGEGKRLHDTLLSDATRYADMLTTFGEVQDDATLREAGEVLRNEVANVSSVDVWRAEGGPDGARRKAASAGAEKARALLAGAATAETVDSKPEQAQPVPEPVPATPAIESEPEAAANDEVEVLANGIMADLWG